MRPDTHSGIIVERPHGAAGRIVSDAAALVLVNIIYALFNPDYIDNNSLFMQYAAPAEVAGRTGDLLQTLASNLTDGWLYSNVWQIEAGRLFQTPALFLFGMWLGRKKFFECSDSSRIFWKKALFVAIIASAILYPLKEFVPQHLTNITILSYYSIIAGMIYNFFFMIMLVASFMLLWFHAGNAGYLWQRFITPFGRMSLTNYIGQSIIGVACYYHFGFDLWDKTGAAETLLIGIAIFMALLAFSRKWLATHSQGHWNICGNAPHGSVPTVMAPDGAQRQHDVHRQVSRQERDTWKPVSERVISTKRARELGGHSVRMLLIRAAA